MAAQIPLERFGTADDIANAVIFLATDASAYITGQVLAVDGNRLEVLGLDVLDGTPIIDIKKHLG